MCECPGDAGKAFLNLAIRSMAYRQPNLASNYSTLDDHTQISRDRQPLSHSAGNSGQAPESIYHDHKGLQSRGLDRPLYAMPTPTLPSQPLRQAVGNTLDHRRQSNRKRRYHRQSQNPIVESQQYQAYRARQNRDGNPEDAKWPEKLEVAFLDGQ
jgi:transcriptional enhancer factor